MLWFRAPEKVYFKKGCLPVALQELKDVLGKKRAFIVTDSFLYKNGYTHVITDRLNEMGITYTVFSDVQPDPTLANAQAGAKLMREFEPDVILAMGGGSAMDAGKIMWVLYEHPEVDFMDMAMRFIDIRKRVYTFPKMGEKAYFIAVPILWQFPHPPVQVPRLLLSPLSQIRRLVSSILWQITRCCLIWQLLILTT